MLYNKYQVNLYFYSKIYNETNCYYHFLNIFERDQE